MHKLDRPYVDPASLFRHGGARPAVGRQWLDYSVSLNPVGPPQRVLAELQKCWPWFPDVPPDMEELVPEHMPFMRRRQREARSAFRRAEFARYPDPFSQELSDSLAALHGVEPEQVLVGNGATELIYLIPRTLRPRRVAIAEPTFTEYLRASLIVGARVDHWLVDDDQFSVQPFDPQGADLVWLCNPNNPTGRLWFRGPLLEWIEANPRTVFVVDEAFLPFQADEADFTLVPETCRLPNLVVVRSMTKFFHLAGLRLGYAVAHPLLAQQFCQQALPWSVNAVAQIAGRAALTEEGFAAKTHEWLATEQASFRTRLQGISPCLQPLPAAANFFLVRLKEVTAPWLARRLEERGILIRDASNFVGLDNHYVRIAVKLPRANQRLLTELRALLQEV